MILEEAPVRIAGEGGRDAQLLVLSAKTPSSLANFLIVAKGIRDIGLAVRHIVDDHGQQERHAVRQQP